jgi:hypothetical protein
MDNNTSQNNKLSEGPSINDVTHLGGRGVIDLWQCVMMGWERGYVAL